jgi:ketosteroid isomerase-like protein
MPPDLQENRRLVRHYFDLLNRNDLSGLQEILFPDVVFFGPRAPEGIRGGEAFIEFIAALGRELPESAFRRGRDGRRGKPSGKRVHYDEHA